MSSDLKISKTGVYGVLVNSQKNSILSVKREKEPYAGLWDVPGVMMQDSELMLPALRRAFKQDCSIELKACWQLRTLDHLQAVDDASLGKYILKHVGVLYQVDADLEKQKIISDLEHKWISIEKISMNDTSPFLYHAAKLYEAIEAVKKQGGNIANFLLKQDFSQS